MKYFFLSLIFLFLGTHLAFAQVVITEIMYDPKGTDGNAGGEWIEVQNTDSVSIDLTKWIFFEADTNHSITTEGVIEIPAGGYAVISKDLDAFKNYFTDFSGLLFKSSFSLNDSETLATKSDKEIPIFDSVTYMSEWGAKNDGDSLQKLGDSWIAGAPTPGMVNSVDNNTSNTNTNTNTDTTTVDSTPPPELEISADAGKDKTVMAGADAIFEGKAFGTQGEPLTDVRYLWNFGDGGTGEGKSVLYHYTYPGEYVAIIDVASGKYSATDHIRVQVIPASINITAIAEGPKGFIEITNSASKELDISWWRLRVGEYYFTIPKNTHILPKTSIKFASAITNLFASNDGKTMLVYPNGVVADVYHATMFSGDTEINSVVAQPQRAQTQMQGLVQSKGLAFVNEVEKSNLKPEPINEGSQSDQVPIPDSSMAPAIVLYTAGNGDTATPIYTWFLVLSGVTFLGVGGVIFMRRRETAPRSSAEIAEEIEIIEE